MADVFISYSRRDGEFVRDLHAFLEGNGRDVWVDWEDIPPASRWEQDIEESIAGAESVVFVVSNASLTSEYCLLELSHAQKCGKRIVPLACDGADPGAAPEGLRQLNWIWCRESDDRDDAFARLTRALDTDLEWAKAHTRLLVRAVEWEARQDASLLLRGRDLEEAAQQVAVNAGKEPVPTELQQRYLLASRRAASKRQRIVLASVLCALAVSVALGVVALLQRNTARTATRAATSVALASAAIDRVATKPDEALLLALEANSSSQSAQARNAAVTALQAARQLGVEAFLHGDAEVRSVDFAPDGRTLAVGSADGAVRLWDARAAAEPVELRGPGSPPVVSVEFTSDGRTVAAGSAHGVVRLWDAESRRPVGRIDANRPIRASAVSPDGESVAAIDTRGRVWLWNLRGGEPRRLPGARGEKALLVFSPDGKTLAVGATDLANVEDGTPGAAGLVDVGSGRVLGTMPDRNSVTALAFSRDGKTLATGGYLTAGKYPTGEDPYGEVRLWNVPRLEPVGSVESPHFVHSVAFAPDGSTVAVGRSDGSIQLAAPKEGKWIGSPLRAGRGAVTTLGLSPDAHVVVAAAADDTTVRVWDLRKRNPLGRIIARSTIFGDVAISPGGGAVAAADGYDGVLLVRTGAAAASTRLKVPKSDASVDEVAFSGDGNKLAASSGDGAIHVWDLRRSGPPVRLPPKGALESHELVLDHAGETIADWGLTEPLRLWDVPGRKLVRRWEDDRGIVAAAFVGAGKTLVAAGADGSVEEWDVDRAETRGAIARPGGGGLFADVSADGRTVAFGDGAGAVRLWDRRSDAAPAPLPGGPRRFPDVVLSADGRTLAVTREDGEVQLWDVQARTPLGRPLSGTVNAAVAFSGDGSVVATAADAELRLWEGILWRDLSHLREQVCGLVAGHLTRPEWTAIAPGLDYPTICSG